MAGRWRKVSRSEYMREMGLLSGKIRRLSRLRSEYFSLMGKLSGLARERARLYRRIPVVGIVSRVIIGDRIRAINAEYEIMLNEMREIYYFRFPTLEREIAEERTRLAEKIVPPPPPIVPRYQHKIVVCNIDTTRAGVRIVISITLWFDVRIDVQERFEREAIGKIHRWLDASFYGNIMGVPEPVKLSEEEKRLRQNVFLLLSPNNSTPPI
ncbi:unnamed protein product, partial [marine sediment metagenome]